MKKLSLFISILFLGFFLSGCTPLNVNMTITGQKNVDYQNFGASVFRVFQGGTGLSTISKGQLLVGSSTSGYFTKISSSSLPYTTNSLTSGYIFAGNGAGKAVATSTIFLKGGNVGIGTTVPSSNLNIQGATGLHLQYGSSWGEDGFRIKPVSDHSYIGMGYYSSNNWYPVADIPAMVIKSSPGYVGIGTTTPLGLLHVAAQTGTSTVVFGDLNTTPACFKMVDTGKTAYTYCTFSAGTMTCSATNDCSQ